MCSAPRSSPFRAAGQRSRAGLPPHWAELLHTEVFEYEQVDPRQLLQERASGQARATVCTDGPVQRQPALVSRPVLRQNQSRTRGWVVSLLVDRQNRRVLKIIFVFVRALALACRGHRELVLENLALRLCFAKTRTGRVIVYHGTGLHREDRPPRAGVWQRFTIGQRDGSPGRATVVSGLEVDADADVT